MMNMQLTTPLMEAVSQIETTMTVQDLLPQFAPITLSEMADVALQDRVDTKYVMGISQLYPILQQLTDDYRVLDIHQVRLNHYLTLYFDTPDFALYREHHNGWGTRYKVRARKYVDSDLAFFEIKHKTNQHRTIKSRIPIPDVLPGIVGEVDGFVDSHTPFAAEQLEPKLWNEYYRVTLVSTHRQERVTLDMNVSFFWGSRQYALPGIAIAEIKQGRRSAESDFIQHMREAGIRPSSFSKYTAGVYSLYNCVKANNFKQQIRQINRIMQEELSA